MPDDRFLVAANAALAEARMRMLEAAEAANRAIVEQSRPSSVVRVIDGVAGAALEAYRAYQVVSLSRSGALPSSRIVYRYQYMREVVAFALGVLRDASPVGSTGDRHPGLYRDSHTVFVNGQVVADVSVWQPGQTVHISNPVPYSRKIEAGAMRMSVPGHVYETAAQIVAARYGNQVSVKFTFMPVRFGDARASRAFSRSLRTGRRRVSEDWLARQPALEIKAR